MPFVLDASVALSWHFEDEVSEYADKVLDLLKVDSAYVPSIWPLELANVLLMSRRRGRISPSRFVQAVELSLDLPVFVHAADLNLALGPILELAQAHGLTAYDAAYLELAMRLGLPIATEDTALLRAAPLVGLPDLVFGDRTDE